jgi:hypothetical protein
MKYNSKKFCASMGGYSNEPVNFVGSLFIPFGTDRKSCEKNICNSIQDASADFLLHLIISILVAFIAGGTAAKKILTFGWKKSSLPAALFCAIICIPVGVIAFAITLAFLTIAIATRAIGTIFKPIIDEIDETDETDELRI